MSMIYVIDNTDGTLQVTIPPGALNGPGGTARASDLRLYGLGALQWGEGVDENVLRIAETFACPKKALGDTLPLSLGAPVVPNALYDPGTHPILPKDEYDLGTGSGITKPLRGQQWYNIDDQTVYVYTGTEWTVVSGGAVIVGPTPPITTQIGDLWYDTTTPQLMIWNGTMWVSVADRYLLKSGGTMTGYIVLNADPVANLHPVTLQYLQANYSTTTTSNGLFVQKIGDTMSGDLSIQKTNPKLSLKDNGVGNPVLDLNLDTITRGTLSFDRTNDRISLTKYSTDGVTSDHILYLYSTYAQFTQKARSLPTDPADPSTTLVTKGYVDNLVSGVGGTGTPIDEFTATSGQTVFNTTNVSTAAKTGGRAKQQVFVNGVLQREVANYNVTGTNRITFTFGLTTGDEVVIYQL